jgi:hypothetical protein
MTREQLVKHWDVIEAYKNGKEVQYSPEDITEWIDHEEPSFNLCTKYRVKPEPEYIPFDFSDAEMLIGKVIKDFSRIYVIISVDGEGVVLYDDHMSYTELFVLYTFLDGSKCGKLKSGQ